MAEEQVRSREIDYQTAFRRQCRKGNNCGQDVEEGERREAGEKMERRSLTAFGIMHTHPILLRTSHLLLFAFLFDLQPGTRSTVISHLNMDEYQPGPIKTPTMHVNSQTPPKTPVPFPLFRSILSVSRTILLNMAHTQKSQHSGNGWICTMMKRVLEPSRG